MIPKEVIQKPIEDIIRKAIEELLSAQGRISSKQSDSINMHHPGIYAIFVKNPTDLPEPFQSKLIQRKHQCLYIGKTESNLTQRLVQQDLRHKQASAFFRSLGAILKFRPIRGSLIGMKNQNNFKFSPSDTATIIEWINEHTEIKWVSTSSGEAKIMEQEIISYARPLLNLRDNPDSLEEVRSLLRECRRIARNP